MSHSKNFDKIYSFLKLALNIFILRKYLQELLKRGLLLCIKSIDLGDVLIVGRSRIHQNKIIYGII